MSRSDFTINVRDFAGHRLTDVLFPCETAIAAVAKTIGLVLLGPLIYYPITALSFWPWNRLGCSDHDRLSVAIAAGVLVAAVVCIVRHLRNERRWRGVLQDLVSRSDSPPDDAADLIRNMWARKRAAGMFMDLASTHGRRIAQALQALRLSGMAVRVATLYTPDEADARMNKAGAFQLGPFPYAFEPTRLTDARLLFERQVERDEPALRPQRRARRVMLRALLAAVPLFAMLPLLYWLFNPNRTGALPHYQLIGFSLIFCAIAATVSPIITRALQWRGSQFYLVPGGGVEVRHPFWKGPPSVTLFSRDNSNLIVLADGAEILLTRAQGRQKRIDCTPLQRLAWLNAWLCPAAPPTLAQLSDLADPPPPGTES